jgi:putative ABC transport system substrate-binding protein
VKQLSFVVGLCAALLSPLCAGQSTPAAARPVVSIVTVVEVPALLQAKEGVVAALAERGFVVGKNLSLRYENAAGEKQRIVDIVKALESEPPSVVVALTTPMAQALQRAGLKTPVVFGAVTDPVKAGIVPALGKPAGNITGASDLAPLAEQLKLVRALVPKAARIGFIYDARQVSPASTLAALRPLAEAMGIQVVEASVQSAAEASDAARGLAGRVDAVYLPNDTTVNPATEAIVALCHGARLPVFTAEGSGVKRGALASIGNDYGEVGRLAGQMAADVLSGRPVGQIDIVFASQKSTRFQLALNRKAASEMAIALPADVVGRATSFVD